MTDDKKNIPDVAPPTEASAPTAETATVPEPPVPEPVLTDAEAVMLEHEGQAALFEMGETVPNPADAVTRGGEACRSRSPQNRNGAGAAAQSRQGRSLPGTFRQGGGFCRCP